MRKFAAIDCVNSAFIPRKGFRSSWRSWMLCGRRMSARWGSGFTEHLAGNSVSTAVLAQSDYFVIYITYEYLLFPLD